MIEQSAIPTKLAMMLLENFGEITLREIRALPFVNEDIVALAIADILAREYDIETYKRRPSQSSCVIDQVLRLTTPQPLN